jgi:hypothetical protein
MILPRGIEEKAAREDDQKVDAPAKTETKP